MSLLFPLLTKQGVSPTRIVLEQNFKGFFSLFLRYRVNILLARGREGRKLQGDISDVL